MEHLIQPIPGPQYCRMQSSWHCSAGEKNGLHCRAHTSSFIRSIFHKQLCHTHTTTYLCMYVRTYIHTYLPTYRFTFSIFHHLLCLSFLPCPAKTIEAHYWKKLTCGVIRSFNFGNGQQQIGAHARVIREQHAPQLCACWLGPLRIIVQSGPLGSRRLLGCS